MGFISCTLIRQGWFGSHIISAVGTSAIKEEKRQKAFLASKKDWQTLRRRSTSAVNQISSQCHQSML